MRFLSEVGAAAHRRSTQYVFQEELVYYRPGFALYGEGPAPCVVRINRDGELDEAFTTDLTEWTDGKLDVNFST